jgi:hypothetical protein
MAKKSAVRAKREARISELRQQCQVLSNERVELETINEQEDASPWIGACFKYRNTDSSGKSWWLYVRVTAHEHGQSFRTLQCQAQPGGWNIVTTSEHVYLLPDPKNRGFTQITRREFDKAWRGFVARIESLNDKENSCP